MFVFKAAVVGAGTMGGQIAQTIAAAGIPVLLKDVSAELVDAGRDEARRVTVERLERLVSRERLTREEADAQAEELMARITGAVDYAGFGDVDFVVEAVPERMAVKQAVFAELDAVTPGRAILASNTSSLSITEIGEATLRPDQVVGFHYFFPAAVMPLVEIVRGDDTSAETIAAGRDFALALRKQAIVCDDVPGFVVNRVLMAGLSEIWRAQEEGGLSIEAIDTALIEAQVMPMGPFALIDMLGLDTVHHVAEHLRAAYGDRFHVHQGIRGLVEAGRLGAKTGGRGVFADGEPQLAGGHAAVDGAVLAERLTLRSFVEACALLEEGVCTTRGIDLGLMAGAGLDPRRGLLPPFVRADATGLDTVLARLEALAAEHGERFTPPTTLRRLVTQGRRGPGDGQGFYAYPRPDAGEQADTVKLETRGAVAVAWLAHGPINALTPAVIADLRTVWDRARAAGVRALVLASSSPLAFSAGADVKAFATLDTATGIAFLRDAHALLGEFETDGVVTIAAVNGLALGGGCELAMACDVRLASRSAVFGQPEVRLGIIPGFGGTQRLPRLVGRSAALEMNLLGGTVDADTAWEHGLVNRVVADHELFDVALAWARRLAQQAPRAVAHIKAVSGHADLDAGLAAEQAAFAEVFASADAREGIDAFLAKRAPRWTGR